MRKIRRVAAAWAWFVQPKETGVGSWIDHIAGLPAVNAAVGQLLSQPALHIRRTVHQRSTRRLRFPLGCRRHAVDTQWSAGRFNTVKRDLRHIESPAGPNQRPITRGCSACRDSRRGTVRPHR
jgi:hypothetical protein